MNCTVACAQPLQGHKKDGLWAQFIKKLKAIRIDGAEEMSKTK